MKQIYKIIFGAGLLLLIPGCGKVKFPGWQYEKERGAIVFNSEDTTKIEAEIFADATISMSGYSTDPNSRYNKFIDDLASLVETSFKTSIVKFYRFGANSTPISSAQFLAAKKPSFYKEYNTNIDEVIKKTQKEKISIVITDLFQDQKNLLAVVTNLKANCLEKGLSLAILGIPSEFDGKVFDANVIPFNYKTTPDSPTTFRPFYVFMLGSDVYLEKFYKNLAAKNPIYKTNFLLISGKYVSGFEVEVEKDKASKGIKKKRSDDKDPLRSSHYWVVSDKTQQFDLTWGLKFPQFMPVVKSDNIKFRTVSQTYDAKKETYSSEEGTKDLQVKEVGGNPGDKIKSHLVTSEGVSKITKGYKVFMEINPDSKVYVPKWVSDFSSDDPSPSRGPNKTLNLEKFVSDLIKASWVINQPKLGVAFLTIAFE